MVLAKFVVSGPIERYPIKNCIFALWQEKNDAKNFSNP